MASAITTALLVSIETLTSKRDFTALSRGMTRAISSFSLTVTAFGRVDSPPISIMSTPLSIINSTCAKALSKLENCPPSENESGVTFKIPMT